MIYDIGINQSIIQQTVSRCNETIYQRRVTLKCQDMVIFGHFGSFRASGWAHQGSSAFTFILI